MAHQSTVWPSVRARLTAAATEPTLLLMKCYRPNIAQLGPAAAEADGPNTLVLAFASRADLEDGPLPAQLRTAFPRSIIAGCSTAGHFLGPTIRDDEPAVIAARFDHSTLRTASVPLTAPDQSAEAGRRLGEAVAHPELQAVMVLSDGLNCNGSALVAGLLSALPPDTTVFGGLAADGDAFGTTAILDGEHVGPGRALAVAFIGDRLVFGAASRGGWDRFGLERTITASDDSVLKELDGEPALDLYKRYLDDRADELPGSALLFPLAIRPPDSADCHHLVRTVLGIDEDDNSMTFAGDMPVGWRAQMMRASFDALVDGAADSAELAAVGDVIDGDTMCLAVTCVGRRLVLGSRTEDELEAVADALDATTHLVGYYAYGEIGPGTVGECALHNQTMTLATIGER